MTFFLWFGLSLIMFVILGVVLLNRGKTFAGIMILVFLTPVYLTILIRYLNHLFPFR